MKTRLQDRRNGRRQDLVCPVTLYGPGEQIPITVDHGNICDEGLYVAMPAEAVPAVNATVDLTFCVPRASRRLDVFATRACVIRHQADHDTGLWGVAMRFKHALDLTR